jgi:hypothetical protein
MNPLPGWEEFRENIFLFKKSSAENLRKKDRRIRAGYSN